MWGLPVPLIDKQWASYGQRSATKRTSVPRAARPKQLHQLLFRKMSLHSFPSLSTREKKHICYVLAGYWGILVNYWIYYIHFEITGGPCNLIGSNWCNLFPNCTIFALNHIISPANEEVTLQTCRLSRRFRERLRYTVELSSNQK